MKISVIERPRDTAAAANMAALLASPITSCRLVLNQSRTMVGHQSANAEHGLVSALAITGCRLVLNQPGATALDDSLSQVYVLYTIILIQQHNRCQILCCILLFVIYMIFRRGCKDKSQR